MLTECQAKWNNLNKATEFKMVYPTEFWNQDDDEFSDDISLLDLDDRLEKFLEDSEVEDE